MKKQLEIKPKSVEEFKKIIEEEGNFECWKSFGLVCFVYRWRQYGHWCGYVGVSKKHPLYGVDYDEPCEILENILKKRMRKKRKDFKRMSFGLLSAILFGVKIKPTPENVFEVHGGITFSGKHPIWKIDDRWFFGFDTAHHGDLVYDANLTLCSSFLFEIEKRFKRDLKLGYTYKTKEYVIEETKRLAKQIAQIK